MTTPIPASGYPSNTARTQSDIQTYLETMLSIQKEVLGGTSEAASVQLSGNTFVPGNNACVFNIDTNGLGPSDTLNSVTPTNVRDGEVIIIRSTNNARVITVTNGAGGAGQIYTADGNNVVLSSTKTFLALKYNIGINAFEEVFRAAPVNLAIPGPIGGTTPNTATFTSLTVETSIPPQFVWGNNGNLDNYPSFVPLNAQILPENVALAFSDSNNIYQGAVNYQSLDISLNFQSNGTIFGNFQGDSEIPQFNAPGTANQVLGVTTDGTGLEYKTIAAGTNVTVTNDVGQITIAASGGGGLTNPMTTPGDSIYGAASGTPTRLAGNTSTVKEFLSQTGTGSASAAPVWGPLASGDVPWATPGAIGSTTPSTGKFTTLTLSSTVAAHTWLGNNTGSAAAPTFSALTAADLPATAVNTVGSLSPLFTSAIATQALSFTLSSAAAGSLFGNFTGAAAVPTYHAPGTADQILGVAHTGGGLEYKTVTAGANITVTPAAGAITIAATGLYTSPMTTLGDTIYGATAGAATRLAGNITTAKQFLSQTGTGSVSASPVWGALASADIPWSTPGAIGSTTASSAAFTTITASGAITQAPASQNQGPHPRPSDFMQDMLVAGLTIPTLPTSGLSITFTGNSATITIIIAQGSRIVIPNGDARLTETVAASQDTYMDISPTAGVQLNAVANGATAPAISAGYTRLAKIVSGTSTITAVSILANQTPQIFGSPMYNQCRLYGASGLPYGDTTSTGTSTLYFGPTEVGNLLSVSNSSSALSLVNVPVAQQSQAISGLTAGTLYYVTAYLNLNIGAVQLDTASNWLAWTGNTPPATVTGGDNRKYKSGDYTRLIVGIAYALTATTVAFYPGLRGLWNMYNRKQFALSCADATASWTYALTTIRVADGLTSTSYGSAIIGAVQGIQGEAINLQTSNVVSGTVVQNIGIGNGSTTVFAVQGQSVGGSSLEQTIALSYSLSQPVGFNYYSRLESLATATSSTFYGAGKSGMYGTGWF